MDSELLLTDLDQLPLEAQQHRDDFEALSYMLELNLDVTDSQIDAWVNRIAEPIIDAIDCTKCGHCCRVLDVYLTEQDAQILSQGIDIALTDIIDHETAWKFGEWGKLRAQPCTFLQGNLCSVYAHRPESCRAYPVFTPDFRWTIDDVMEGASICPIIYNVLMTLYRRIDELYEL